MEIAIHRSKKDGGCRFYQNAVRSEILQKDDLTSYEEQNRRQLVIFILVIIFEFMSFGSSHLFLVILTWSPQGILVKSICRHRFCCGELIFMFHAFMPPPPPTLDKNQKAWWILTKPKTVIR